MKCPICDKDNDRVLIQFCKQPHKDILKARTKGYYHFICANCRFEFDFVPIKGIPISCQLHTQYINNCRFQVLELEDFLKEKISNMTVEQMERRLKELDKKSK